MHVISEQEHQQVPVDPWMCFNNTVCLNTVPGFHILLRNLITLILPENWYLLCPNNLLIYYMGSFLFCQILNLFRNRMIYKYSNGRKSKIREKDRLSWYNCGIVWQCYLYVIKKNFESKRTVLNSWLCIFTKYFTLIHAFQCLPD